MLFFNIQLVESCEIWIRKFALDYCNQAKTDLNPLSNFNNLKIKYKKEYDIKLKNKSQKEINNLLLANIKKSCPKKNHTILRIIL